MIFITEDFGLKWLVLYDIDRQIKVGNEMQLPISAD